MILKSKLLKFEKTLNLNMFSFESKLHYEKVLGPAKRFVPKSEKDDSEWESTLDSRLN